MRRAVLTGLCMTLGTLCASCTPKPNYSQTAPKAQCESISHGKIYFQGSVECFRSLPQKRISGFWLTGNEFTAFFPTKPSAFPLVGESFTTFVLSDAAWAAAKAKVRLGERQLFEVQFVGVEAYRLGYYAPGADTGVFAESFTSIKEITLPNDWGAH
ncbi:MAG: hypothetical protein WDO12_08950 [Pseudomonadota bacterium]